MSGHVDFLFKGDLKRETNLIFAAQEQTQIKTYEKDGSDKCRLCGISLETVSHIVSACSILAHKEYKRHHDKVCTNLQ